MRIKNIFTVLIVLFPILSVYATIIPGFSIADFLLTLIFPFAFLQVYTKDIVFTRIDLLIYLFIVYLLITLIYQVIIDTGVGVVSTIRYILYLITLVLAYRLFDFKLGISLIIFLSKWISVYVVMQFISFNYLGFTLPWKFPLLPVIDTNFLNELGFGDISAEYRPTGIFYEPTHYSQFVIIYLTYILSSNIEHKTKLHEAILPVIGILASGSSFGLIFLVLAFLYWFLVKQKKYFSFTRIVLLSFLIYIMSNFLFQIEYFKTIYTRLIPSNGELYGPAMSYRFDSVFYYFEHLNYFSDFIFGFGRSSEKVYFTGIFYFLNANGLIGVFFFIFIISFIYNRTNLFGKMLALNMLILSIGTEIMANFGIFFYLAFCLNIKQFNYYTETLSK